MKQVIGLALGFIFGFAAAFAYQKTAAPPEGSVEDELERVEHKLRVEEARAAEFEARLNKRRVRDTSMDRARDLAQKLRDGEEVSLDDVFDMTKPMMRNLSPLIDRMRLVEQGEYFDTMAGELTRKYELSESQRVELKAFLQRRAEQNLAEYNAVIESDTSGLVDLIRTIDQDKNDVGGIDDFMEGTLSGEKLAAYREQRMDEKVKAVQSEADRNTERLDGIVGLSDEQRDEVFVLMARGADDYDPAMGFEGLEAGAGAVRFGQKAERDDAFLKVLTAEQRVAFEEYKAAERLRAEEDMRKVGLTLPKDWDLLEGRDF